MFDVNELLAAAILPPDRNAAWLHGAGSAVDYLVKNTLSNEIIIFTNAGQALTHSVLVPSSGITPPHGDALQHIRMDPYAHWALEHVSGGGQPDRMYLSPPVDSYGCKSLEGAEQLVFRRQFTGVDKGPPRTELSQPLVQALDLYWLDEESAYCKLDEDGDVEPVIRLRDLRAQTGDSSAMLVTIKLEALHRYMAVTETVLVTRFDFTRYIPGSFGGWSETARNEVAEDDLFYNGGIQANGSFVNGALILRPILTKAMLIERARRSWNQADKKYTVFKAHDWKNARLAEISCSPSDLASYFETDSPLPFQTTPAFFRPDVLQKYKSDPDKYRLEHRSIHARGGWHLKTYDVNEAGQVHTYLCYLADLPYKEQLYWESFNEWPKAPISLRAKQTDFEGCFSTETDALEHVKYEISKLDGLRPPYWQPRGDGLRQAVHYPLTASVDEWSNAILALDQLVIEGFATKPLRNRLTDAGRTFDKQWGTLKLLQEVLIAGGMDEDEAADIMASLRTTHDLRSKTKGHAAESEKAALVKKAKTDHGSLPAHFKALVTGVQETLDRLIELL